MKPRPRPGITWQRDRRSISDVIQSADFFLETRNRCRQRPILRQAFLTQYYYGDIERAAALGRQLESLDVIMPLGGEPGTALAIRNGDWPATLVLADRIAEDGSSQVMAGLIRGWALVADGRGDAGISALLEAGRLAVTADGGMPAYFRLNAALMAERPALQARLSSVSAGSRTADIGTSDASARRLPCADGS